MNVAVIGCGIFGAMAALRLAEGGAHVTVLERQSVPLAGASFNNHNRLHLGFHYPRDEETARQCLRGFTRFCAEFPDCIVKVVNAYFIAAEGSRTSSEDYLHFIEKLGVPYGRLDAAFKPEVRAVALGIVTPEVIYDCTILRELMLRRLAGANVVCTFDADVVKIARDRGFRLTGVAERDFGSFDYVVNCTYADINRLGAQLGHPCHEYQYEYTFVPILAWDQPPISLTIMDGNFFTVLPFGKTPQFLLYHVEHSVVARTYGTQMPEAWRDVVSSPAAEVPRKQLDAMTRACCVFIPALAQAKITGFLRSPRVVLPGRDKTDERPSIVREPEPGYVTVFAGKIDHCMWAADDVRTVVLGPSLST